MIGKIFYIRLTVAIVILLAWYLFIFKPLKASYSKLQESIKTSMDEISDLEQKGYASQEQLNNAQEEIKKLEIQLRKIVNEVLFKTDPRFAVDSNERAKNLFDKLKIDLFKEIRAKAASRSVVINEERIRDLGFPREGLDEELAKEFLLRLSLATKILTSAIESEVIAIIEINPFHEVDNKTEITINKDLFLNHLKVKIGLKSAPISLFKFVHSLQKKEDYLAIEAFALNRENIFKNELDASFVITALIPSGGQSD